MAEQNNNETVDLQKSTQEALNSAPDVPAIVTTPIARRQVHPGVPNSAPVKLTMRVESAAEPQKKAPAPHVDQPKPTQAPASKEATPAPATEKK
jgi:hypothetical protein